MPKAMLLTSPGSTDQFTWADVPMPELKAGEVLIRHHAVGLNYIDVYHRTGLYALPSYPAILGMEAAGVVEKTGAGCKRLAVGDRVAYGAGPIGAYCEYRTIAEDKFVKLPDAMAFDVAASLMLKGLTAQYLLRRTYKVAAGDTVLIHAAAGGVGLFLCQWAKYLGARIIGTVGSKQKAEIAKQAGCDEIILYSTSADLATEVRDLTQGKGVQVVYDGIGKDTYTASLNSLAKLGMFVSFGQASGPLPLIDSQDLAKRGSLFLTRPSLMHYAEDAALYHEGAHEVFDMVAKGVLTSHIGQKFSLQDLADAHKMLEARETKGSTILTV